MSVRAVKLSPPRVLETLEIFERWAARCDLARPQGVARGSTGCSCGTGDITPGAGGAPASVPTGRVTGNNDSKVNVKSGGCSAGLGRLGSDQLVGRGTRGWCCRLTQEPSRQEGSRIARTA
jgi:hypothetical protein